MLFGAMLFHVLGLGVPMKSEKPLTDLVGEEQARFRIYQGDMTHEDGWEASKDFSAERESRLQLNTCCTESKRKKNSGGFTIPTGRDLV